MVEFFHMGGYALYVWGSFGVVALFMMIEPVLVNKRQAAVLKRISRINRMKSEENR